MIVGVTHTKELIPRQSLAVYYKVGIGLPAGDGRNHPTKLDHISVFAKNAAGEYVEAKEFIDRVRPNYCKQVDGRWTPLREISIFFMKDPPEIELPNGERSWDLEELMPSQYAWWTKSAKQCSGNGIDASRSIGALKDKSAAKDSKDGRTIPWALCGPGCQELESGLCKPTASLYFRLADDPRAGSTAIFNTTSKKTIIQLQSSLLDILQITGGRLQGIPLNMVLRPGKTRYKDPKDGSDRTGNAFFVNLEFRQQDRSKLLNVLLEQSLDYDRIRKIKSGEVKLLKSASVVIEDDDVPEAIEHMPEEEQAAVMGPEFYPETSTETTTTIAADMKPVDDICAKWQINQARKDVIFGQFKGDVGSITEWFSAIDAQLKRIGATPAYTDGLLQKYGLQPVELLKFLQAKQVETAKPETQNSIGPETEAIPSAARRGRKPGGTNKPKPQEQIPLAQQAEGTTVIVTGELEREHGDAAAETLNDHPVPDDETDDSLNF